MSYKYENGVKVQLTPEEEAEQTQAMLAQQNREKLEAMQKAVITTDDLMTYLLTTVKVTLPDGTTTTGDKVADVQIDAPVKLGYKLQAVAGSGGFAFQYVADPEAVGTAENPIIWYEGCPLINNAFYVRDGKTYVYMNGQWIEW